MHCGCMCTGYVKCLGEHRTELSPVAVWKNSYGEPLVECRVDDLNVATMKRHDLGTRFIYATPTTWKATILEAAKKERDGRRDKVALNLTVSFTNASDVLINTDGFRLLPSDVRRRLSADPPTIRAPWTLVEHSVTSEKSPPHFTVTSKSHSVEVHICTAQMILPQIGYKSGWGKFAQVLIIPAAAVDIVTFPIQLIITMQYLDSFSY